MRLLLLLMLVGNCAYSATESQATNVFNKMTRGGVKLKIVTKNEVNASCDSGVLTLYTGMIGFANNPDELAIVIGHELSHCYHHDTGSTHARELRSDREGLYMAYNNGYNVCLGIDIMRRMYRGDSKTHPSSDVRYRLLSGYGRCN